jgi:serine/threonine protein kinase
VRQQPPAQFCNSTDLRVPRLSPVLHADIRLLLLLMPAALLQLKLLCRLKEVAQAMQYLHARNVVHGDLKVANVLLATDPTAPFGKTAKVTDFGLSRALQVGVRCRRQSLCRVVNHRACFTWEGAAGCETSTCSHSS